MPDAEEAEFRIAARNFIVFGEGNPGFAKPKPLGAEFTEVHSERCVGPEGIHLLLQMSGLSTVGVEIHQAYAHGIGKQQKQWKP